jgi:hypothetical protein
MTKTSPTTTRQSPHFIPDVPRLRCRYNLRGLDPQGQCPECGHLVHLSVLAWDEERLGVPSILESDPFVSVSWLYEMRHYFYNQRIPRVFAFAGSILPLWRRAPLPPRGIVAPRQRAPRA